GRLLLAVGAYRKEHRLPSLPPRPDPNLPHPGGAGRLLAIRAVALRNDMGGLGSETRRNAASPELAKKTGYL
ncbi:MAG: hypothetical protein OXI06_03910, partial [bacterium]|nr:hypothetical protein [bacterium]